MDFYIAFNKRKQDIEEGLRTTKNPQEYLNEVSSLLEDVRNNKDSLNTHDLDRYERELALLSEKCRLKPKKFAFASKINAKKTSSVRENSTVESVERQSFKIVQSQSNLDNSLIYNPNEIATEHLSNISNSVIYLPNVHGPLYLTNITDSVIVSKCHQFRIHKSHDCEIYLGTERPIIENCTNLRFGPPIVGQKWSNIDDFDWIRDTPSKNWSAITTSPDLEWIQTDDGRKSWIRQKELQINHGK